jgi:thiamine biosynthesis lipoprotein
MGTFATVTLIAPDGKRAVVAMDSAFAAIDSVNSWMNPYSETSEIYALNNAPEGKTVRVNPATFTVLMGAAHHHLISGGAFDVTVGPFVRMWKTCSAEDRRPGAEELRSALRLVGMRKLRLNQAGLRVWFTTPGMQVDLGGIAKGYAIDAAVEAIRRAGVQDGIVEIGGDLRCFGSIPGGLIGREARLPVRALRPRPGRTPARAASGDQPAEKAFAGIRRTDRVEITDRKAWPLGIQSPFGERLLGKIHLHEGAVATSGHYRRFVTIGGQRFSHIIDPRSGMPVSDPASVTVIAPDALTADALATAITVLGAEAGLAHADSLPGVEALIISGPPAEPQYAQTAGFPALEALAPSAE